MKTKVLTIALLMLAVSCTQKEKEMKNQSGMENGYTWVDLGLNVKWATMNVGATTPEGYGDYFAWGDTAPKSEYSWETYNYCKGTYVTLTKYCVDSKFGIVDNKTSLELTDDAAHENWGGNWRMPTDAEWTELRNACKWTWTTQNGVNGYLVTGKNGSSVFFPAAGYRYDENLDFVGLTGNYWSSSLNENGSNNAYILGFSSNMVDRNYNSRYHGYSIRAVCR